MVSKQSKWTYETVRGSGHHDLTPRNTIWKIAGTNRIVATTKPITGKRLDSEKNNNEMPPTHIGV